MDALIVMVDVGDEDRAMWAYAVTINNSNDTLATYPTYAKAEQYARDCDFNVIPFLTTN